MKNCVYMPMFKALMRRASLCLAATVFACVLVSPVLALPEDAEQELKIDADSSDFDVKSRTTNFRGNVVLEQGSLKIRADKLVYYGNFDDGGPRSKNKIVATGKPAQFQQIPKPNQAPVVASANRLEYVVSAETLFLIDNAKLKQDGSSLSGNRIEYDVKKALVKASGDKQTEGEDGRVRMVIPPKTLKGKDNEESTENGEP